ELWQLVAARALLGAGSGLFLPAARRAVIIADPSRQAERLGTLYGAFLGGFVFGPPIAAFVAERTNLHVPFLGLGGIIALGLVGLVGVRVPGSDGPATSSKGVLRQLARNRTVLAAVLVVIAFRFSIGVFEPIWARFLTDKGASTFVIGLSLTVFAAPMIVVAPIGGRFADRHGARWASLVAGCATVPFMASYGWFSSVVVISGLALAHGLFEAIESPGSQAAVADAAPREHAAAAQGLAEAGGSAAAAIAALATAPFYAWAGAEWTWMAAAAVMAAVFGLSALLDPPQRRTLGEGGRPGPLRTDRLAGAGAGAEAVP
ncbi:MAG: MFS transporter, partial [Acidimicrobiia bacterium]|nr:MFS transporter [Acidimicrobiia bacterium]